MAKQKKSFFDRIIGLKKEQEQECEEQEKVCESRVEDSSVLAEEVQAAAKLKKEEKEEKVTSKADDKKQEWFGKGEKEEEESKEEEGQLTIDVYQTKDSIVIMSIIGGVRPEDLDISVANDVVTIKGVRKKPEKVKEDDYYYQECFWGSFSRSVILPCDIRTEGIEATLKNGILTIKLPKIEGEPSMKIKVREE